MTRPGFAETYGPWAVVTGASDGIGAALARALAAEGLSLLLVARREGRLAALAADLSARHGTACRVLACDLADPAGAAEVVAAAAGLDVGLLVAAAGFGTSGPFLEADLGEELAMLDVNCRAVLALVHPLARRLAARGRGGVVLMSSLLAFQGVPRAAGYAATKAWVQTLAEGLRPELAAHGVDVLAAAPGPVNTGFAARAGMRMGFALRPEPVAASILRALGRRGTVRPGWLSVALEASFTGLPRRWRARILGQVMRGMTAHRSGAGAQEAAR